jgi:iron-sulfur cluster repair protein YtfE (RIC family)
MTRLRQQMLEDHEQLSSTLGRLLAARGAPQTPDLQQLWAHFEAGLLAHFEAEEQHLLPLLVAEHGDEAVALRMEHAAFRELLAEIAGASPEPNLDSPALAQLASRLQRHAQRENELLYAIAESIGDERLNESLRRYLSQTYQALRSVSADD